MITDLAHHAAAGPGGPRDLFPGLTFASAWRRLAWRQLDPGQTHEAAVDGEAGCLVVRGAVQVTQAGASVTAAAPAVVRCAAALPHALTAGPQGAGLVLLEVACAGGGGALAVEPCSRERLPWRDAIHGGGGRIGTRHLWRPEEFASPWTFADHAVLTSGSSLGLHYHDHLEECFVVLAGRGRVTIGEGTSDIGPGAVTWHPANVGHGLHNPFAADLDFLRVAVAAPEGEYTTVDLNDDLRTRLPTRTPTPESPT